MGKVITISQTLLDGLKWLMEGNNWLFLTPVLLISAYVMFRKWSNEKKHFLIFVWYLVTISILSLMLELAFRWLGSFDFCCYFHSTVSVGVYPTFIQEISCG